MVRYIHKAFNKNLNKVRWMDTQTKAQALIKSEAIKPLIGYPSEILNETILMDFYSGVWIFLHYVVKPIIMAEHFQWKDEAYLRTVTKC